MGALPKKRCVHCRKLLSCKGMSEHVKFHCSRNPRKQQRSYSKKVCPLCRKSVHEKGLRVHMLTVHNTRSQSKKQADALHQRNAPEPIQTSALKTATRTSDAPRKHVSDAMKTRQRVETLRKRTSALKTATRTSDTPRKRISVAMKTEQRVDKRT